MSEVQAKLQEAMLLLHEALSCGQRFVYISEHPTARAYRGALGNLVDALCAAATSPASAPEKAPQVSDAEHRFLFIGGCHKSGTTLLRNLLDGHPQFFVLPGDGLGWRLALRIMAQDPPNRFRSLVQAALGCVSMPISGEEPLWILGREEGPYIGLARALRRRSNENMTSPSSVLNAFAGTLVESLGVAGRSIEYVVEKSTYNVEDARELSRLFPSAKFLQIVRHPGAIIAAQKKKQPRKGRAFCLRAECEAIHASMLAGAENRLSQPAQRWLTVRFEDILSDPSSCMGKIAAWAEVENDPILIRPTVVGIPAGSNTSRFSEKPVAGHLASSAGDRWRSEMNGREADFLDGVFGGVNSLYGYESRGANIASAMIQLPGTLSAGGQLRASGEAAKWAAFFLRSRFALIRLKLRMLFSRNRKTR